MQERSRRTGLPEGAEPLHDDDPAVIGAFEVIGRLGEGGMGAVYLGRGRDGRHVAIKVIRRELAADAGFRARFQDEVSNARKVASFCTAAVLDHGEERGSPYLVTEYVAGTPLEEYIERHGALPAGTLHGVAVGVAAALTAIHAAGLVHRDLKPSNVLLSVSGPRVIDFGIARATDAPSQHTQAGFVIGTPGWMAPEQVLDNQVGTAVDIFAWGCLVALAGTGRHPFGTGNAMVLAGRAATGRADLDGLEQSLRGPVERALAPRPEDRPDAQELLLALVGGGSAAVPDRPVPQQAQAFAVEELDRTWRAEALPADVLPPPWTPASPPYGVPQYPPYQPTPTHPPMPAATQMPPPPPYRPASPAMQAGLAPTAGMGAPPQPRRRRGGAIGLGLTGCGVTVVVLLALLIGASALIYFATDPADGRIGAQAPDGQFTFVSNGVRCDVTIRGVKSSRGKFCSTKITVRNTGTDSRLLAPGYQVLEDSSADSHDGWSLFKGSLNSRAKVATNPTLSPGDSFTGYVVFDVPRAFQPEAVVLHDAEGSNGVRIPASKGD